MKYVLMYNCGKIQGVEKCKATGETKTGKWFGREEKTVEDLPKDFKKYYDKMINKEITKVQMLSYLDVAGLLCIDELNYILKNHRGFIVCEIICKFTIYLKV